MWDLFSVNYCKYYFEETYQPPDKVVGGVPNKKDVACDEYPFASTKQGAGMQDGNYSIKAVSYAHNDAHGEALAMFYADYRVVPDSQFWVKIVS
ncbi:hypothetical protein [Nonomuraea sp. NPDC003804]|uniref:NucA/NucB deoxyribonuclease domain-containing protein n=1 Tax=Nonomuraea sp. NPDC003804 TaxID=3154547 RepID=UPI0033A6402F